MKKKRILFLLASLIPALTGFASQQDKQPEQKLEITYIDSTDVRKGLILKTSAPDGTALSAFTYHYPEEVVNGDADYFPPRPDVRLQDVNFDGHQDIVISLGRYGIQGVEYFDALVWNPRTRTYVRKDSFRRIPNPVCRQEDKAVYSFVRNTAASYTYGRYEWTQAGLVQTAALDMVYTVRGISPRFTEWRFYKRRKKLLHRNVPESRISRYWLNAGLIE